VGTHTSLYAWIREYRIYFNDKVQIAAGSKLPNQGEVRPPAIPDHLSNIVPVAVRAFEANNRALLDFLSAPSTSEEIDSEKVKRVINAFREGNDDKVLQDILLSSDNEGSNESDDETTETEEEEEEAKVDSKEEAKGEAKGKGADEGKDDEDDVEQLKKKTTIEKKTINPKPTTETAASRKRKATYENKKKGMENKPGNDDKMKACTSDHTTAIQFKEYFDQKWFANNGYLVGAHCLKCNEPIKDVTRKRTVLVCEALSTCTACICQDCKLSFINNGKGRESREKKPRMVRSP
jgi:hypothetical protein